jgi:septal ring factor EnvC (AmiA/AmiB activator)
MTKREVNREIAALKDEKRMVMKYKRQFDKKLNDFHSTWFEGRVVTNEIIQAGKEQERLAAEIEDMNKSIKRYEDIKQKL